MPSDSQKTSKHRSSDRSKHRSKDSSGKPRHRSSSKDETQKKVKDTAKTVGDGAGKAYDSVADLFGGEKELNRTIRRYNPTFHDFAEKSFLKNFTLTNRPSKFLFFLIALALIQSFIPLFQWPLDFVARWLGFMFLFNSGLEELKEGFESSRKANKIKSLLTVLLVSSAIQLIPNFLFDTYYHFGALWAFFLPVVLFITPWKETPDQTLASMICDTFFGSASMIISSLIPDSFQGENGQNMAIMVGAVIALLFWVGYLGSTAAYVAVWCYLALSTIDTLGRTFIKKDESSSGFFRQMKIWHNLLAIWLWRYLISAIEGISIPGLISVIGLIQYYLPTYFLWMTGFMFAMLMTKKTEHRHRIDTWYAKWLLGIGGKSSSSIQSSSGSGSGHRTSSRSSDPAKTTSGSGKHRSTSDKHKKTKK
ncbi:uncharacterized protein IL334_007068 [Kwoniella shivajii]|uniref:Uncharacterized protein n=1 Tax=Kwoniella shivajii TaxID=564305 RepID=A0ABZ1D7N3_9TREE|nr:hypothetical protein IL334_007068 [Kwoniella shivajii]